MRLLPISDSKVESVSALSSTSMGAATIAGIGSAATSGAVSPTAVKEAMMSSCMREAGMFPKVVAGSKAYVARERGP